MTVSLTKRRQSRLLEAVTSLMNSTVSSIQSMARVVGLMVASFRAIPRGRLFSRRLENYKNKCLILSRGDYSAVFPVPREVHADLSWWPVNIASSCPINEPTGRVIRLSTDASDSGWGGYSFSSGQSAAGSWSAQDRTMSINARELKAVHLVLLAILGDRPPPGLRIALRVDNTTAVSYINKMGGHCEHLLSIARAIWLWAFSADVSLSAQYIPSADNWEADSLSRLKPNTEWSLNRPIFDWMCESLGVYPDVDLFASAANAKLSRFISWQFQDSAFEIDAFSLSWDCFSLPYAFPPFSLIGYTLQKALTDKVPQLVIVIPFWKSASWFPLLSAIAQIRPPLFLGQANKVLSPPFPIRTRLQARWLATGRGWPSSLRSRRSSSLR